MDYSKLRMYKWVPHICGIITFHKLPEKEEASRYNSITVCKQLL